MALGLLRERKGLLAGQPHVTPGFSVEYIISLIPIPQYDHLLRFMCVSVCMRVCVYEYTRTGSRAQILYKIPQ